MKHIISMMVCLICLGVYGQDVSKLHLDEVITTDGLFVDSDGTIYATEGWSGDKVYTISPSGVVSVFAQGLKGPIDILKGKDDNFYVSEWNAPQLSRISKTGKVEKFVSVKMGAGPMTQDTNGNLFVTHNVNDGTGYISKVTLSGEVSIFSEGQHLINPGGIDFDSNGNLYVSNFNNANIVKVDSKGKQQVIATVPGDKEWRTGHLKIIGDVIYVSALMDHRIYKVSLDGKIETLAGTGEPGNAVGEAKKTKLFNPNGLFYDNNSGQLLFSIAFAKSGFIQKIKLNDPIYRSEYFAGIAFRETPYADIIGTRPLSEFQKKGVNHFQFDYDKKGRLIMIRYLLNGKLKPFSNRFVRAPKVKIKYQGNNEIRTFFNEHGHRTVVSGDVYEVRIERERNGDRKSLKFYDVNGKHIENDFRIATYNWMTNIDGTVIEKRYDINNKIQRNRPGFGYYVTKFTYDHKGLLRLMTNLGKDGVNVQTDDAGIAHTKIGYDSNASFVQWLNLDISYASKRGMSNIAEIRYRPAPLYEHSSATFIDADGKPQATNWGAHIVKYTFDNYGNATTRRFLNTEKQPTNAANGVGLIKTSYSKDGRYEAIRNYYNKEGKPVEINGTQLHEVKTDFDSNNHPIKRSFYNLERKVVVDSSVGYAIEKWVYDNKGRLIERQFLNTEGELVNHATWQVARMVYDYKSADELSSVTYFNAADTKTNAIWNPIH